MSSSHIAHNVVRPWTGTDGNLAAAGTVGGTDIRTSEWFDTSGWTDRVVSFELDSDGTIDFNVFMHISSQGAYELNNKTCTTEDYVSVTIVNAHTAAVYVRFDSDDFDELKIPVRSTRFVIENDQAEPVTGVDLRLEGWS